MASEAPLEEEITYTIPELLADVGSSELCEDFEGK